MRGKNNLVKIIITIAIFSAVPEGSAFALRTNEKNFATVHDVQGMVEVKKDADWEKTKEDDVLFENNEIRTGKDSHVKLHLGEEGKIGQLELKPESRMRLNSFKREGESNEKTTVLDLAVGQVLAHVEKVEGKSQFYVRTANSVTGVRGTTFLVSADPIENKAETPLPNNP